MDNTNKAFKEFLMNYCWLEKNNTKFVSKSKHELDGVKYKTYKYEIKDHSIIEIKDIIPLHISRYQPVFLLNFQEIMEESLVDQLIQHLIANNFRIIITNNSFYTNKDLEKEFILNGLSFWKSNIVSQLICMEYLREKELIKDINTISINGFNGGTFLALKYYEIACNNIYVINGLMDFNKLASDGEWNQVFSYGLYEGFDKEAVKNNEELQNMNPYILFNDVQAEQKYYFSTDNIELLDNVIVKKYNNNKELMSLLMELV